MKTSLLLFCILFFLKVNAQESKLVSQPGHANKITGAVVTNDGRYIITVASDHSIILWNARLGRQLDVLYPDQKNMDANSSSTIIISPNQKRFLVFDNNRTLLGKSTVYQIDGLKKLGDLSRGITFAGFSIDGKSIVGVDDYGGLKIYDAQSIELLREYEIVNLNPIAGIDFLALGKDPALKDKAKLEKKLEEIGEKRVADIEKKNSEINSLYFNPDGIHVLSSGTNNTAVLWNIVTGKKTILKGHTDEVTTARFSIDGKLIATASNDKSVKIWNVATAKNISTLSLNFSPEMIIFSPATVGAKDMGSVLVFPNSNSGKYPELIGIKDGLKIKQIEESSPANIAFYSKSGKYLIRGGGYSSQMTVYDAKTFKLANQLSPLNAYGFSTDSTYLVTAYDFNVMLFDARQMNLLNEFKGGGETGSLKIDSFDGSGQLVVKNEKEKQIALNIANTTEPVALTKTGSNYNESQKYSYEVLANGDSLLVEIWDKEKRIIYSFVEAKDIESIYRAKAFSPDDKTVAISFADHVKVISLETGKLLKTLPGTMSPMNMYPQFSPDSRFLVINPNATNTLQTPMIVNVLDGTVKSRLKRNSEALLQYCFSPRTNNDAAGGQYLVTLGYNFTANPTVKIWDTATGELNAELTDKEHSIKSVLFSPDGKSIITDSEQDIFKQWSCIDGKLLSTIYPGKDGTVQITADGYYMGDKNAIDKMYVITKDFKIISVDQHDVKYNRPDKVLAATGSADTTLQDSYKQAYVARLKNLKTDSLLTGDTKGSPQIKILNEDYMVTQKIFKLHLVGTSSTAIRQLHIWVNNVPVYGKKGLLLGGSAKKSIDTLIDVELSAIKDKEMKNKLEVALVDDQGKESERAQLLLNYKSSAYSVYSKVHFIGIGMGQFADATENLSWSIADIRKMVEGLRYRHGARLIVDTLFNENLNRDNLALIKNKLKLLGVDDRVIIAYSGHGINRSGQFYLPMYATDFDHPEKNSLLFTELENILDDIAPRQKLMLLDACNSGDYDRSVLPDHSSNPSKRLEILSKNSFELMRDIFANMEKGTGATVIASSGMSNVSIADASLKHSVFMYSVLELIYNDQHYIDFIRSSAKYDLNPSAISALLAYVKLRVPQLSENLQQPIVRSENTTVDWGIVQKY